MKIMKKEMVLVSIILYFFLSIPFIYGATVVQISEPTTAPPKTFWQNFTAFLTSPFFIWTLVIFVVVIGLIFLIAFGIRWVMGFIKQQNNIFFQMRGERLKLAKAQRRYNSKKWLKYTKNTPIRMAYRDENKFLRISSPIAYHKGDYMSQEGNLVIAFNMDGNNNLFILPRAELLIIPNKKEMKITVRDGQGKITDVELKNVPTAKEIVQFNDNEILLFAKSITKVGNFYVPVLEAQDGSIIDLATPVYESLKSVALGELLYEQTDLFSKVAKKSIDLNPHLRYNIKSGDSNQQVEVPTGSGSP
jgi:type IV secretory pathway VirB2 component (pilin)